MLATIFERFTVNDLFLITGKINNPSPYIELELNTKILELKHICLTF